MCVCVCECVPALSASCYLCAAGGYSTLHGSRGAGGPTESGEHRVVQAGRHLLHGTCALGDDVKVRGYRRLVPTHTHMHARTQVYNRHVVGVL